MFNSILNIGVFVSFRVEQRAVRTFQPPGRAGRFPAVPPTLIKHTHLARRIVTAWGRRALSCKESALSQFPSAASNSPACIGSHEHLRHPVHKVKALGAVSRVACSCK